MGARPSPDGGCCCHYGTFRGSTNEAFTGGLEPCCRQRARAAHPVPLANMGTSPLEHSPHPSLLAEKSRFTPYLQSSGDERARQILESSPSSLGSLGVFGEPLWFCECARSRGPFGELAHSERTAASGSAAGSPLQLHSPMPLPAALFMHVALFLAAEDVTALASVCKGLRWLASNSKVWMSLCISEQLVFCSRNPAVGGTTRGFTGAIMPVAQGPSTSHSCRTSLRRGDNAYGGVHVRSRHLDFKANKLLRRPTAREAAPLELSFSEHDSFSASAQESHNRSDPATAPAGLRCRHMWRRTIVPSEKDTRERGCRCRGLQLLPEHTLDTLVDWWFLFLLNRLSPGPRIYVRVRDVELQFPLHPVTPHLRRARRPSSGEAEPRRESQDSVGAEEEKNRQGDWGGRENWVCPQRYVSIFIQRAINIRRPMRLRHLRPGGRPGLCAVEILRDQHYLLEWQVPLRCLLEPISCSAFFVSGDGKEPTLVWPLPPYGMLKTGSLATQLELDCRERKTIYSVVHEDQREFVRQVPDADPEYGDRLIYNVLDCGSAFATLLSPLSDGTTAAAIVVGAVLVAVATASATAAITTAAAATATLAARRSRIFRVDLHVIERDEHEDDHENMLERDSSPTCLIPGFSGTRAAGGLPSPAGAYDRQGQLAAETVANGQGQQRACQSTSVMHGTCGNGQVRAHKGSHLGPVLPYLQRLIPARVEQLIRSSRLPSLALTELSLAFAITLLSTISREAITTASAALAAAGAAFSGVLLPPETTLCPAAKDHRPQGTPFFWMHATGKQGKQGVQPGVHQITDSLHLQLVEQTKSKAAMLAKHSDSLMLSVQPLEQRPGAHQAQAYPKAQCFTKLRRFASERSLLRFSTAELPNRPRSRSLVTLETRQLQSSCSTRVSVSESQRRFNSPADSAVPTGSSERFLQGCSEEGGRFSTLRRTQRGKNLSLWRWAGHTCRVFKEMERGEGSRSEQGPTQLRRRSETDAVATSTRHGAKKNFCVHPLGCSIGGVPSQAGHGLLLFVRTYLPSASTGGLVGSRGGAGCCDDVARWDGLTAALWTSQPEDIPLLLPMDATASDLVRVLFLTLTHRSYMLPLISGAPVSSPTNSSYLSNGESWRNCRRIGFSRLKSSSPTLLSRRALLRFWFVSTHRTMEQPQPSAKLTADLRFMSCERLSLSVAPFVFPSRRVEAHAHCLTLVCPRGWSARRIKRAELRGVTPKGFQYRCISPFYNTLPGPSSGGRRRGQAIPTVLPPGSVWKHDNPFAVLACTPSEGEPILMLRREATPDPRWPRSETPGFIMSQDARPACSLARASLAQSEERTIRRGQCVQQLRSRSADGLRHVAAASRIDSCNTGSARPEGIILSEEDFSLSRPWILQSSVNTRQFEYHPQKDNVMLTGSNDGRVRLLDWEKDVTLGAELVDSHQILGLSWLKHHPELFVCAAGVSGIPYVIRWREQDDFFSSVTKGDRGRMPRCAAPSSQAFPSSDTRPSQPPVCQRPLEAGDCEAEQEEQSFLDREDFTDGSTVAAALTWFRRYGRGGRETRGATAPLRIVHQYCACEDLTSVSVNSTDDYLLVSGRSADLAIHDVATGAKLGTLRGLHSGSINIVRFAHTSPHLFVTASFDQTCRLWDVRQRINGRQPLLNVEIGSLSVMCSFDDSDEWLLCSGVDAALRQVCLRTSSIFPESFSIPPVNAETNFRRAVYLQGGREFITAGTEEGFFRVFSRLGQDLGVVSLEGLLRPFIQLRTSQNVATLPVLQNDFLNLRIYLRSHVAPGLSAVGDAAWATAAGVSRFSVASVLRAALRHLGNCQTGLVPSADLVDRMRQTLGSTLLSGLYIPQRNVMQSSSGLLGELGPRPLESRVVEEYVQSLRAHPRERRLVGALLAAKDRVETTTGELSFVAMSRLPANMLK